MKNQLHLMFDIETMDNGPTAAVVAIGARLFTIDGPTKGFEVFIDPASATNFGTVGIDTMNWWAKQPARELVFGGKVQSADAWHRFLMFVSEHQPETIWANSPSFDCVIGRYLADQLKLKFPFHYRDERDFRTVKAIGRDLNVDFEGCWEGMTAHSPLDDATAQAKAMTRVLRAMFNTPAVRSGQGSVLPQSGTLHLPASGAAKPSETPQ
jgi:3' exoribonuclease, RNase T-like